MEQSRAGVLSGRGVMTGALVATALLLASAMAAQPPPAPIEFAFEARITLAPATVLGDTGVGHRQYIPITGGTVKGPLFNGEVIPGGWDYQLRMGGGCNSLTADYFLRAADGAVIHILNEGLMCGGGAPASGERNWLRPKFEAPKGPHEWMTRATFVASLELERPAVAPGAAPAQGAPPALGAIRVKFYRVK